MKKLALVISCLVATNSFALTQTTTQQNLQNELKELQKEIALLNKEVSQEATVETKPSFIALDTVNPYAFMPSTSLAYSILQSKDVLNNPLVIGGEVEADLQKWGGSYAPSTNNTPPDAISYHSGSGVSFSSAAFYTVANFSNYFTGVAALQTNLPSNSVSLGRAFINVGNLDLNPLYFTGGDNYLPVGAFDGNGPWSNALTTNMFRAAANQAVLGWHPLKSGLNVNVGVYQTPSTFNNDLTNYLANATYTRVLGLFTVNAGAGYLSDLRGDGSTVGSAFTSQTINGIPSGPIYNSQRNGMFDANIGLSYGEYGVTSEYVTSAQNVNKGTSTTSNGKLDAWMVSADYTPVVRNIPITAQVSYSATDNMANVPMPLDGAIASDFDTTPGNGMRNQWLTSVTGEVYTNVYVGPEFQYAKLYSDKDTWTTTLDASAFF